MFQLERNILTFVQAFKRVIMITRFGQFLEKRAVNKSKLAELTGITRQRLSELSVRENAEIRFKEAVAIAKAFSMDLEELSRELLEETTAK